MSVSKGKKKEEKDLYLGEGTKKEMEKLSLPGGNSLQIVMVDRDTITTLLSKWLCKVQPEAPYMDL